jgi:arylsulfatase A-like enzyme
MCTPDLRGSQGTFSFFTDRPGKQAAEGGEFKELDVKGTTASAVLEGPPDPSSREGARLKLPFTLDLDAARNEALLKIGSEEHLLKLGVFSEWVHVPFKVGRSEVTGICRFCIREISPNIALYVSPINVDPEKPALPISEPVFFSTYLAKKQGPFGTLGLLEDTWARNEYALDDQRFLDQTYLTHQERERMFLDVLDRTREGICICVFDASDRIQHMFWRYIDEKHPSPREENPAFQNVIPEMYERMDALIGKVRAKLKKGEILMVISDHGFSSFRRGINLNTWLMQEGYLVTKSEGVTGADYFGDVDWSRTKAFAVGLSGLYINRKGRERLGIVPKEEAESLKQEISDKLEKLLDPADMASSIRRVYDTAKTYKGIYTADAPDLVVGYEPGYRVSWDSVTGKIEPAVFSDNIKAWSGDHHVDPEAVPGIFFCSEKAKSDTPHIMDIAPTVLNIFDVPVPGYMEGKVIV